MAFFDLHLHPSTKPFLTAENAAYKTNCWEKIPNNINIIDSQSCLDQVTHGGIQVAVAGIYPLERAFSTNFILRYIAPSITALDAGFINNINAGAYTYYNLLQDEILHLSRSQQFKNRRCKIINSIDDLDPNCLNIILAIEGGHALEGGGGSYLENLYSLKQGPNAFLYLTLTHLTHFNLCTHAFGMKLINNNAFKPQGQGITPLGLQVIDAAYDNGLGRRILIDIKHMSLLSRLTFYDYRRQKGHAHIPLIASHAGATGISYRDLPSFMRRTPKTTELFVRVKYRKPKGISNKKGLSGYKTSFNPWSINLFDEDILEIIQSGGLIGLSLDQRIVGTGNVAAEFFSRKEFEKLFPGKEMQPVGDFPDENLEEEEQPEQEFELESKLILTESFTINSKRHTRHLCNNILHFARIGGATAWKQTCIGSDFDGLINPVNSCTSATHYAYLEQDLIEQLHEMTAGDEASYHIQDIRSHVRDIMYNNALAFLSSHFKA